MSSMRTQALLVCCMLLAYLKCSDSASNLHQASCASDGKTYTHSVNITHNNGCGFSECQYGQIVTIHEACGKEIDKQCHPLNEIFIFKTKQYQCAKQINFGLSVYHYKIHRVKSGAGCSFNGKRYKHLDNIVSDNSCSVRQCQDGHLPFTVIACWGNDNKCHYVNTIWTHRGVTYICTLTDDYTLKIKTHIPPLQDAELICTNNSKVDLLLMLDSSNSINKIGFGRLQNFVCNLIKRLVLGKHAVQVACLQFSTVVEKLFYFNVYYTAEAICQRIFNITHLKQRTNTTEAFRSIFKEQYFTSAKNGARADAAKMVILVTDGYADDFDSANDASKHLRISGVGILAVGVGVVNRAQLIQITGDSSHVYSVKSYNDIESIKEALVKKVCEAVPRTEPVCKNEHKSDVLLMLDSSNSINDIGFGRLQTFVCNLARKLNIGKHAIQVGCLQFSSVIQRLFYFDVHYTAEAICEIIYNTAHMRKNTNTTGACHSVLSDKYFSPEHGARPDAKKIALMITDGKPDNEITAEKACDAVKNTGVMLEVVGVGDVHPNVLKRLAGDPSRVHVVGSYKELDKIEVSVAHRICKDEQTTTKSTTKRSTISATSFEPTTTSTTATTTPTTTTTTSTTTHEQTTSQSTRNRSTRSATSFGPSTTSTTATTKPTTTTTKSTTTLEPSTTNTTITAQTNKRKVDILCMLDTSNSINNIGYGRLQNGICNLMKRLHLGRDAIQVAILQFSSIIKRLFYFNEYHTADEICKIIFNMPHLKQNTNTTGAFLSVIYDKYFTEEHGARTDAEKMVMLITDGIPDNVETAEDACEAVRNFGVAIEIVGVGPVDKAVLKQMAGDPSRVHSINNFKEIDLIQELLVQRIHKGSSS